MSVSNRPVVARQQSGQHSHRWLVECPKQLTRVTLRRLVYVFAVTVFSSNLLFHCFVRDFIQDNGVCHFLIETDRSELLQGVAINYFGFWITILVNTDSMFWQNLGSGDAKQNAWSNRRDSAPRITMRLSPKPWHDGYDLRCQTTYGESLHSLCWFH